MVPYLSLHSRGWLEHVLSTFVCLNSVLPPTGACLFSFPELATRLRMGGNFISFSFHFLYRMPPPHPPDRFIALHAREPFVSRRLARSDPGTAR